ncbi:MAG: AlkZ-related protein [Terriglobales bacterium]
MTERELEQARRHKWRLDGPPLTSAGEAQSFLESVGLCLMHVQKSAPPLPVFPSAAGQPKSGAAEVPELAIQLLRRKQAFEARVFGDNALLVAASAFPYFYALAGDRNPELETGVAARAGKLSRLAADIYAVLQKRGARTKGQLRDDLGGEPSGPALDRSLGELWARLLITRVDYTAAEGASWDALYRWAPEAVKAGIRLSVAEALSGLVSRYLDAVIAAEQGEVETFFSLLVSRSRVRETIHALLAAREVSFCSVGRRTLLELAPERAEFPEPHARTRRPTRTPAVRHTKKAVR